MTTQDHTDGRPRIPLRPEDIVITDRVIDFICLIIGADAVERGWVDVAIDVVRHWAVGDVDRLVTLPAGLNLWGESVVHLGLVWEALNLALVDDWVREDNNLPPHELVPLVDIVERSGVDDVTPLA